MRFLFRLFLGLLLLAILAVGSLYVAVRIGFFGPLPDQVELADIQHENASLVYSADGERIGSFYAKNRSSVTYEALPQSLLYALIATEDARFFDHDGLDMRSIARVMVKTILLRDRSAGGGSTLSQQLAKNLYHRPEKGAWSMPVHKFREIIIARRLERVYTKNELLTLYLNTVPFGEEVYGIESAAYRFFDKPAQQLRTEESAVLVGMLKANTRYNPRLHPELALSRRNVVLGQMFKNTYLTEADYQEMKALPLQLRYSRLEADGPVPYFLVEVKKQAQQILEIIAQAGKKYDLEKDGLKIETTIDYKLQMAALASLENQLPARQKQLEALYRQGENRKRLNTLTQQIAQAAGIDAKKDTASARLVFRWDGLQKVQETRRDSIRRALMQLHAGIIALDPLTGDVLCWVGGIDFPTQPYDQLLAYRQLASTFKPILYATALESGIDPCSWLSNEPITFTDQNNWQPSNYDGKSGGQYSLPAALAHSYNLPAVDLYLRTNHSVLAGKWGALGFSRSLPTGPATALGTAEANALETAVAYAAFANGGQRIMPRYIKSIHSAAGVLLYQAPEVESETVFSPATVASLTGMLQGVVAQGTATALRSRYGINADFAAKTGTSQDYGDAWFVAYNPRMVVVSRVGAPLTAIHFNSGSQGSGSALALPLVAATLKICQADAGLRKTYFQPFSAAATTTFDCPEFRETPLFDKIFDNKGAVNAEKEQEKAERKQKRKNFFRKLFGK
jgi:penicillin-binding protein 1A